MATGLYLRVSDDKQEEGVSLKTQEEKLLAFCKYKGFKNTKKYIDIESARTMEKRKSFQQMIADIESKKIKRIVIFKLDRLTRSLRDLMNLLHFLDEHECELHSTIESIDTSTPSGRLLIQVLGIVAEWESTNISTRVSMTMQHQSERGIWMSSVPYGYDLSPEKRLVINEKEAELFRKACSLILNKGYSFLGAYKYMAENYGVDWSPDFLSRKMEHETTVGNIMRNGKITYNTHEPLISKETRDKLLNIKRSNLAGRARRTYNDIFRRRIRCYQCNNALVLSTTRKRDDGTYYYSYQCTDCYRRGKKSVNVAETIIENALIKYMGELSLSGFHSLEVEKSDDEKKYNDLKFRLDKINRKRDRIQRAWIDERMSDTDLEKYSREIEREEQTIKEEMSALGIEKKELDLEELKKLKILFRDAYQELTRNEKLEFIQSHIEEIHFRRTKIEGKNRYKVDITNVVFF